MKKMIAGVALTVLVASAVACDVKPTRVGGAASQDLAESLTYVKDTRSNLCYAVVAVQKQNEFVQSGMSITYVPCTPEVLALIGK